MGCCSARKDSPQGEICPSGSSPYTNPQVIPSLATCRHLEPGAVALASNTCVKAYCTVHPTCGSALYGVGKIADTCIAILQQVMTGENMMPCVDRWSVGMFRADLTSRASVISSVKWLTLGVLLMRWTSPCLPGLPALAAAIAREGRRCKSLDPQADQDGPGEAGQGWWEGWTKGVI